MHTIYYIHVIKDIYKSRQFHPPTMLHTYTDFSLSRDSLFPVEIVQEEERENLILQEHTLTLCSFTK